jgi:hypothetical protein
MSCRSNCCNHWIFGAPHRRLEWQISAGRVLAVRSGQSSVAAQPLAPGLLQTSAVLPSSKPRTSPQQPSARLGRSFAEECTGMPLYPVCLLESHNRDRSMRGTAIDGARGVCGADRCALRRPGERDPGYRHWRLSRQFRAREPAPLRTRLGRNGRVGSNRGEEGFGPRERGPARSSGRCWRVHSRG